ncbi:MAG: SpaH/EbpB family LPXTG-anchored major pilin [Gardnerella vaginalis]|nr:SpaH/EbpB family LPXTG-anchored major pilin [Gardnerella vaginalis]MDK8327330.1 SpaH/EbpB family LPXTG-anchored major pilin [Gardnerella vaginalis]
MRLNTNSLKRTVAVLAAVCTLGTCCIAGSIAYAKDAGVNTATIDTTKKSTTSITIHKYENNPAGTIRANGEEVKDLSNRKPVKGVKFTLWRLKKGADEIDLSTSEGWKKIKGLENLVATAENNKKTAHDFIAGTNPEFNKYTDAGEGVDKASGKSCTTGEDGSCKFEQLPMGLYYVEETDVSGAQLKDGQTWKPVSITKGVDPFFVTTPLANETTKKWIYDVNVYPKNDTSTDLPKKTPANAPSSLDIKSNNATTMSWDITIPLNLIAPATKFTTIKFTDPLMKDLVFDAASGISDVKISKFAKGSDTASTKTNDFNDLTKDTDYTVTTDTSKKYAVGNDQKSFTLVTVALNNTGLGKADSLYKNLGDGNVLKLTAKITAKVKQGATKVVNVINTEVNNTVTGQKDDPKPCVPTTSKPCDNPGQSVTNFATLKVTKVNEQTGQDKKTLKGAEFEVYAMKDNATSTTNADVTGNDKGNKKVEGVTLTTGDNGEASVELFIGNGDTTSKKYCIVETKAPAGYQSSDKPTCYDLTVEGQADAATKNSKEVVNKLSTALDKIVGALPMTGARGLVLLTAFGIVGLGGTLFYIITRRRKEQEEA